MRLASCSAMSGSLSGSSLLSITGTSTSLAISLALTLSPNLSIVSGSGPTNVIPSSRQRLANSVFSDKKP